MVLSVHVRVGFTARLVFIFQAEDGIRDLVRSRGLGDVYKRQITVRGDGKSGLDDIDAHFVKQLGDFQLFGMGHGAVSYTHLTLPTSDLV